MRLFRGRFNGGQARNDFNVRLALFLLLRLDFVRVGLDIADFGKNGRVALRFVGNVLFPIPGKGNVAEHDSANRTNDAQTCKHFIHVLYLPQMKSP